MRIENRPGGYEGLLPISQLTNGPVEVGGELTVKIAHVDTVHRRIELALAGADDAVAAPRQSCGSEARERRAIDG